VSAPGPTIALVDLLGLDPNTYGEYRRYEVSGVMGEGAMGKVLAGRDKKLDRDVAIKIIIGEEPSPALAARFYREAKIAASLNHANIVKIIDYSGPETERQFIVMERLVGHDLQKLIEHEAISEAIVCALGHEIARALSHAHAAGLVHRDVKPENIFVEPDGRVVLLDFGIAKGLRLDNARQTFAFSNTNVIGTPLFGSPEQFGGEGTLTSRSDLFSLGSLLYYARTQVYPFQGKTLLELLSHLGQRPPLAIDQLVDVSPEFAALIERLLQKRAEDRPADANAVARSCEDMMRAHGVASPSSAIATWVGAKALPPSTVAPIVSLSALTTAIQHVPMASGETAIATVPATVPLTRPIAVPSSRVLWIAAAMVAAALLIAATLMRRTPGSNRTETAAKAMTAAPEVPLPVPASSVFFVVKPWGRVWIDGQAQGLTPAFRRAELTAGSHVIEVRHPTLGERSLRIEVAGAPQDVVVDLTAPQ
jgi:predicted Ser/Thr protein kinase